MGYSFGRRPRYGKKCRQECKGGCLGFDRRRWHDSIEEARYCDQLALFQKAGEIQSYRSQVVYPLKDRNGGPCGHMRVDFEVIRADGRKQIHEYKGKLFATLMEYKTKKALFTWNYPEIEHITVQKHDIVL